MRKPSKTTKKLRRSTSTKAQAAAKATARATKATGRSKAGLKAKPAAKAKAGAKGKPAAKTKPAGKASLVAKARALPKPKVATKPKAVTKPKVVTKPKAATKPMAAAKPKSSVKAKVAVAERPRARPSQRSDDADAFIPDPGEGPAHTRDDLAEVLAEDFLTAATSGNDVLEDDLNQVTADEVGGPFVMSRASAELADDVDGSNPVGADREPFPRAVAGLVQPPVDGADGDAELEDDLA